MTPEAISVSENAMWGIERAALAWAAYGDPVLTTRSGRTRESRITSRRSFSGRSRSFPAIVATFFPTGRSVQLFPDIWKGVAGAHYPIANHTYSHQSLKGLCYQLQLAELLHDESVLDGFGLTMLPVMRPPYEEFDEATRFATTAAGESHVVLWDVDTMDWTGLSDSVIARHALAGRAGSIVLMHTSPLNTARALPTIISRYRARGFTFVTVGQMLGVEGAVPFP